MIKSIQIKDFRGIQQGRVDRFRQFNLLVGPNNSGKSALMEALYLAGTAGRSATLVEGQTRVVYEVTVPDNDLLRYHPLSQVWRKHSFADHQSGLGYWREGQIVVRTPDSGGPLTTFDLSTGGGGFARGEEEVTGLVGIEGSEHNREQGIEGVVEAMIGPDVLPFTDQRLLFLWHRELTYNYKGSATWLVAGVLPVARRVLFFDVGMIYEHLPLAFYRDLPETIPGWADRISRHFGAIFDIRDPLALFVPPSAESRWVQGHIGPRDGRAMRVDSYGDGARIAFKVLVPLVTQAELVRPDEAGLFLWEEPELFQHPQSLGRLLQEVVKIVKDKPIQVFMSTQSLEVAAYLAEMLRQGRVDKEEVMAFRLNLEDGQLRSSWFDADNLVFWLESGRDLRMWGELAGPLYFALWEESE
jgi:hypothetical protein